MLQKAHLNGSKGDPQKGIFWPQKCHFPDFPILTSVGGPWDRNPIIRKHNAILGIVFGVVLALSVANPLPPTSFANLW